jgi:1-hydroxycarotenoid 3,4-desaturase
MPQRKSIRHSICPHRRGNRKGQAPALRTRRIVIIGAGIGGLTAALALVVRGFEVIVLERQSAPGGKMRQVTVGGMQLDAGPTVLTMRAVFEEIFADAGTALDAHVTLRPAATLARHAWDGKTPGRLDLHADFARSVEAIGDFAGLAEARRFEEFSDRARRIYQTLEATFIRAARPSLPRLIRHAGLGGPRGLAGFGDLLRISPFRRMWSALGEHFRDPRLRQLFGRYATYCGSSPFQAPATLMLVAHVEREGVWLVDGGMHRLADALARLLATSGASLRYGTEVREIATAGGRANGVVLATGERIDADAVLVNADVAALASGFLGGAVAHAVPHLPQRARSLSAMTWNIVAETDGFPLTRHNVFFSDSYAAEFDDIFRHRRLPAVPTVYVCAQDRENGHAGQDGKPAGRERLLCLINAPAIGDRHQFDADETGRCAAHVFARLERSGLRIGRESEHTVTTTPCDFNRLFPATGGALYGPASHGWMASFRRPGSRSKIGNLYLAGGSTHPGPGVPMAAISGRLAANAIIEDAAHRACV